MASVWAELKRRNVVKVAVAYAIVAWILIVISATVFPIVQKTYSIDERRDR